MLDREQGRSVFSDYTDGYDSSDIKIKLKVDHTYRVAEFSDRIARSLTQEELEIDIAWLLGMFHDIGRFEQIKQYGTFVDRLSVDHAELGADILFREGLIGRFLDDAVYAADRELIETAVRLHNKFRLPDELDDRSRMFCQILRDADKIDILHVQVEIPFEEIHPSSAEELYLSPVSDLLMEGVYEHRCISRDIMVERTAAESYMSHCMLAFELVYDESRKIAAEQGDLAALLTFESKNEDTKRKFAVLKQELERIVLSGTDYAKM